MALVLFSIAAAWTLSGLVAALWLSRYGHNFWLLALMGLGYGPFLFLIFVLGMAGQQTASGCLETGSTINSEGWIDVLVGLDGTDDSVASVRQILATLNGAVRRVRLATVIDHEISNAPDAFKLDDYRWEFLKSASARLGVGDAERVLLSGQPDRALAAHAASEGFDLIVVAHRTQPIVSAIRGSTSARLARSSALPVLIGPPV